MTGVVEIFATCFHTYSWIQVVGYTLEYCCCVLAILNLILVHVSCICVHVGNERNETKRANDTPPSTHLLYVDEEHIMFGFLLTHSYFRADATTGKTYTPNAVSLQYL